MGWPLKLFLTAVAILLIVALTLYFSGSFKPQTKEEPMATSTVQATDDGTDADGMDDEHSFLRADYNFDGYHDRLEMLDCGASGNCSYEVRLYDAKTKTYLTSVDATPSDVVPEPGDEGEVSFVVTNPDVNKTEKIVCSYANTGAATYYMAVYKYSVKDNTFAQVKEFSGNKDEAKGCTMK